MACSVEVYAVSKALKVGGGRVGVWWEGGFPSSLLAIYIYSVVSSVLECWNRFRGRNYCSSSGFYEPEEVVDNTALPTPPFL